jgi:hypothetical protein
MIVTLDETLEFLDIDGLEFLVTGNNNILMLKYNGGTTTSVQLVNNTYSSDGMVAQLKSAIDTAFTITSVVSFASEKFTIDSGAGATIQYIHLNSTLGIDIGFTEDSSATQTITSDSSAGDPTAIIDTMRGMIDTQVKTYCKRDFEVDTYKETIDAEGLIFTSNFPIISVGRVSIDKETVLGITNTGATTYAIVSISQTAVTLNDDGAETSIAISSTTTLDDINSAVNLVSGWESVFNTTSTTILATDLISYEGLYCLNEWADLNIRSGYLTGYEIEYQTGSIIPHTYVYGRVIVDYSAGYSTMPEDLKLAVLIWIKTLFDKRNEEVFGVRTFTLDRVRKSYFNSMPVEVRNILDMYRKYDW